MPHSKITIAPTDFAKWGKLVKTWATGRNYVNHQMTENDPVPTTPSTDFPKPRSFGEFFKQCNLAGVTLVFDDANNTQVTGNEGIGLIVLQGDSDVFVLRVPPQEILLEHEARFLAGPYLFPPFYDDIYGISPPASAMDTKVKKMTIHAQRVGEYTLNTCG
jgi:hypothetical protein